jgi:hypothetical protein
VYADEKLTAFLELEAAIRASTGSGSEILTVSDKQAVVTFKASVPGTILDFR